MKRVTFITGNGWRHEEAKRLLSGIEVERSRIALAKPPSALLEEVATFRARDGFQKLGAPCFVENTGMYLEGAGFVGAHFKRQLLELGERAFVERYAGQRGTTRVVVAYTPNGHDVKTFEGTSSGRVAPEPRGEGGYGWDNLWIPDGFERTLAELKRSKYVVNMRLLPFLELGAELRGDGFDGVFESHVTVAPCDEASFARVCDELGVKALFIWLPRGKSPRQPMTGAHHRGPLGEVMHVVHDLARELTRAGFEVVRTKVEAVGPHRDLPLTETAAASASSSNYYEHHAKLILTSLSAEPDIARELSALGAHLSRGAARDDGVEYRFVTLRSWGLTQAAADARFDRVAARATELGVPLRGRAREYTVYDSSLEVDEGWMT
jgi:non-canonical purine NTP pyrophosphatase (RdgB/HAM1 family)